MPPPELPADAPRLDVLHPVEEGLLPRLRHDLDPARSHRLDRGLGQRRGVDIPLVGQPRLDHHARAVAVWRLDRPRLGVVLDPFLVDVRDQHALVLQLRDHRLARLGGAEPQERLRDQPIGGLHHARLRIEHVEHVARLDPGAAADLEVVEIMPRRDLHRARTERGIGMFVRHDRDQPPGDRQPNLLPDQRAVPLVLGMHRDRHVGEHRLRPRRRDRDMPRPVRQRIAQVPEAAAYLARLDLQVADRGTQAWVPVHQSLVAIQQPARVQVDEHLQHRLAEALVHREPLVRPVHRTAEPAQLARGSGVLATSARYPRQRAWDP